MSDHRIMVEVEISADVDNEDDLAAALESIVQKVIAADPRIVDADIV